MCSEVAPCHLPLASPQVVASDIMIMVDHDVVDVVDVVDVDDG